MKKPTIIKRGSMTYILYPESVIVGFNGTQWSSYNQYENWNRKGIAELKRVLLQSEEDEYDNPVDQMSLGVRCGIKAVGTTKPKDVDV